MLPRTTFSVVVFCKKTKVTKKGKAPIYTRITTADQSTEVYTQCQIEPERHSGCSAQVSLIGGVDEHPSAVTLRAPRRTVEGADLADTVAALDDVARVSVELPEDPDRDLPETRLGEHSGKEVADAFGAEHLSQRGDGPARCEDVVVESLVVLAVVPAFCRREFQNVLRRIIWKSHLILAGALSRIIRATRIPICRKSVEMVVSPLRMISLIGDSL